MITPLMTIIKTKFTTPIFYLCILLLLFSCASAPVQEMSDARQAIQAAREAGAQPATQPNLHKAESLLKEAELALENGDYKKARMKATQAHQEALRAQKDFSNSN